jgi:hypothetical protein
MWVMLSLFMVAQDPIQPSIPDCPRGEEAESSSRMPQKQ